MKSGIYCITSPSGGQYIGSASSISTRWACHRHGLVHGKHHNEPLQRAANKYGVEALEFEVLLFCNIENLLLYEQIAIDAIRPNYNIAKLAGRSAVGNTYWLGKRHAAETKEKMRVAARLREANLSDEERSKRKAKISAALLAREAAMSEAQKSARAASRRGVVLSQEHKAKISAAGKGRAKSEATRERMKAAQAKRKGIPRSTEVRARIAEATRKAMAARKGAA